MGRRGPKPKYDRELVRRLYGERLTTQTIHERTGYPVTALYSLRQELGIAGEPVMRAKRTRASRAYVPGRQTQSRLASKPVAANERVVILNVEHPAANESRTIFPSTVRDPRHARVLKSGDNSKKIGAVIRKGKWAGMPVYTLTLEERATCPQSCRHWRSCYGNKMPFAERMDAGRDLEWRVAREVSALELAHPNGFVVRLHNLGDFYSVQYVLLWRWLLDEHPALHVFGYSARWDRRDPVAATLLKLAHERWERFAIRFSNAPIAECSTISIEHPFQNPPVTIICPEQLGLTESCSTCGLCWQTTKRIAFIQH